MSEQAYTVKMQEQGPATVNFGKGITLHGRYEAGDISYGEALPVEDYLSGVIQLPKVAPTVTLSGIIVESAVIDAEMIPISTLGEVRRALIILFGYIEIKTNLADMDAVTEREVRHQRLIERTLGKGGDS